MDWRSFVSHVIGSVAWPTAALVAIVLLRREIGALFGSLRKLRWREFEADFDAALAKAREAADAHASSTAETESSSLLTEAARSRDVAVELAQLSPRLLILESWRMVEQRSRELSSRGGDVRSQSGGQALEELVAAGVLSPLDYDQYTILRQLRNKAAHEVEFEVTAESALEYAVLARRLADHLGRSPAFATDERDIEEHELTKR